MTPEISNRALLPPNYVNNSENLFEATPNFTNSREVIYSKKNILKSNRFDVMQTFFFAFTCKFGLVLQVEKVVICINKTNWHHLAHTQDSFL